MILHGFPLFHEGLYRSTANWVVACSILVREREGSIRIFCHRHPNIFIMLFLVKAKEIVTQNSTEHSAFDNGPNITQFVEMCIPASGRDAGSPV